MESKGDGLLGLIARERIRQLDMSRPASSVIESFLALNDMAGLVARTLDRMGIVGSIPAYVLSPLSPGAKVVGPAVTVRNVPAKFVPLYEVQQGLDTQMGEREAYFVARTGDVIVVDGGGEDALLQHGANFGHDGQTGRPRRLHRRWTRDGCGRHSRYGLPGVVSRWHQPDRPSPGHNDRG